MINSSSRIKTINPFRAIRLLVLKIWEEDHLGMSNRCIINNLHQEWAKAWWIEPWTTMEATIPWILCPPCCKMVFRVQEGLDGSAWTKVSRKDILDNMAWSTDNMARCEEAWEVSQEWVTWVNLHINDHVNLLIQVRAWEVDQAVLLLLSKVLILIGIIHAHKMLMNEWEQDKWKSMARWVLQECNHHFNKIHTPWDLDSQDTMVEACKEVEKEVCEEKWVEDFALRKIKCIKIQWWREEWEEDQVVLDLIEAAWARQQELRTSI